MTKEDIAALSDCEIGGSVTVEDGRTIEKVPFVMGVTHCETCPVFDTDYCADRPCGNGYFKEVSND